jgi:hypothetical protein
MALVDILYNFAKLYALFIVLIVWVKLLFVTVMGFSWIYLFVLIVSLFLISLFYYHEYYLEGM